MTSVLRRLLVAGLLMLAGAQSAGAAASVTGVLTVEQGNLAAFADLEGWQTPRVKEILDSGLPLVVRYSFQILSERKLLPDRRVASATVVRTVWYDRVKEVFALADAPGTGQRETASPEEVRRWLSRLENVPVAPASTIDPARRYYLRVKAQIEFSRRSFPLDLLLFFLPGQSETTPWFVTPAFTISGEKGR